MDDVYKAAAEQFLNRLKSQGARAAQRAQAAWAREDDRQIIINNPHHCTVIVNNFSSTPSDKGRPCADS